MTQLVAAASLWWDGSWHSGQALRVADLSVVAAPDDVQRLPGTLLPGLTDHHVHSALVDLPTVRAGGVSAVWDLGGVPGKVAELARRAAAPVDDAENLSVGAALMAPPSTGWGRSGAPPLPGHGRSGMPSLPGHGRSGAPTLPSVRFAGPFLNAPGGYPSDRPWAPAGSWRSLASAGEAADAVDAAHRLGATLIKMTAHAGGPLLSLKTMTAVAEAAHALELPVVVHAEGDGTVERSLDCGADFLAHTPWTSPLDPGLVKACAARMTWISTLDIHGWGTETPESVTAVGNLRQFLSYGGSVRYGTDLGNGPLPPAINAREIRLMQSAGMSPAEILASMAGPGVAWIPGGLDLDPSGFADVLATARVLS
ncbi:amidohydrolase [Actinoplanes sp. NPDC051343]|uniref:amidohydrolase n=1 Tax=Actinoplanes sp. NPDC051343 TaxID=3363906 RepID=UPI0037A46A81